MVAAVRKGGIRAAVSNKPVLHARIELDLAVRALEKRPYPLHVKVLPEIVDKTNIAASRTDKMYAPAGQWMMLRTLPD